MSNQIVVQYHADGSITLANAKSQIVYPLLFTSLYHLHSAISFCDNTIPCNPASLEEWKKTCLTSDGELNKLGRHFAKTCDTDFGKPDFACLSTVVREFLIDMYGYFKHDDFSESESEDSTNYSSSEEESDYSESSEEDSELDEEEQTPKKRKVATTDDE
jgi:hypothetical protein